MPKNKPYKPTKQNTSQALRAGKKLTDDEEERKRRQKLMAKK